MNKITLELDCEQTDDLTVQNLKDSLVYESNPKLVKAINRVIAYYSIPGTWENGRYDLEALPK